jgi:hypothetical protein
MGPNATMKEKDGDDDGAECAKRLLQHLPEHGNAVERALPASRRPEDKFHLRSTSGLAQLDTRVQVGVGDVGEQVREHE